MNWSSLPRLSALKAFAAYADLTSVTAAGDALNVSHAAVSQHLRQLEADLGLPLFDRSGRALALTPEGEALAKALLSGFAEMIRVIEDLTGQSDARPLHIATTASFAANWLMPRLPAYRDVDPETDIVVDANPHLTDPSPGGIDLALRAGIGPWPGLDNEVLLPSTYVCVAAPSLVGDKPVDSLDDLMDFPWLRELGISEGSLWLQGLRLESSHLRSVTQLPGNMCLDAARNGQGVLITARVWVEQDLRAGRLVLLYEDTRPNAYHIVTRPGVHRPALKRFLTWLRREARKPSVSL